MPDKIKQRTKQRIQDIFKEIEDLEQLKKEVFKIQIC